VIINPDSGPGGKPLPGHDYVREVPRLNAFDNVVMVGYVRIHYCNKPISETKDEIDIYAGWAAHDPALGLQGILLDETPNHYLAERAEYLEALRQHIKATEGLAGDRLVSCAAWR
jgi:spherulation-specific family 4 protein